MEKQALLKRGFVYNSVNNAFIKVVGEIEIEVYEHDDEYVWINDFGRGQSIPIPNCKTIKDLDDLIRLFKNK